MDATQIAAGVSALKNAFDLAKSFIGIRDTATFNDKVIELQSLILEGQRSMFASNEAYAVQVKRVSDLETEMARLKAWEGEKQNYELKTIASGAVAYMLKPAMRGSEPPHWLCPHCYENGKKAIFQATGEGARFDRIYQCPSCAGRICSTGGGAPKWAKD